MRKKFLDVLAIDVRDGSDVVERLGKEIKPGNNSLQTESILQPGRKMMIVKIGRSEMLKYAFGDAEPVVNPLLNDDDLGIELP